MSAAMMHESVWYDRGTYEAAEILYHEKVAQALHGADENSTKFHATNLVRQIEQARQKIQQAIAQTPETLKNYMNRVDTLEAENKALKDTVRTLQTCVRTLEDRVKRLESTGGTTCTTTGKPAATPATQKSSAADDDDDIDLFGSDDDDAAPVAAPVPKAKAKAAVVAKSLIVLFVKPWDDETDLKEMERNVRTITTDGLVWGTAQLVDVAYGIKKLQIACVVEDEKVGTDFIEEEIMKFENLVQSVDIASFNKL